MNYLQFARRACKTLVVGAALAATCAFAAYPDRPITLVVPFTSGGTTDLVARLLADILTKTTGATVIVDNKPGAGGVLGIQHVSRAPADGYTLLFGSDSMILLPLVRPTTPHYLDDFIPLVRVRTSANFLAAGPSIPAKNLKDVLALAKAKPGEVRYATGGTGTTLHMAGESLAKAAGIKIVHVPYKGAGPATTDLVGGHVDLAFAGVNDFTPFAKTGQLSIIAMSGTRRSIAFPDVPTFAELGLPDVVVVNWNAVMAPKGTPPDVVRWLTEKVAAAATSPEWFARGAALAIEPGGMIKGDEFANYLKSASAHYKKIVDSAGIKLTD
jgi:tripartite-type tricarboxylate transporter receptor subunit TctC